MIVIPTNQHFPPWVDPTLVSVAACANRAQPAVAARFSFVWCQPGQDKVLEIKQLLIANDNAAALDFLLGIWEAKNLALVGFPSGVHPVFRSLENEDPGGGLVSFTESATDPAINIGTASYDTYGTILAGSSVLIDLPDSIWLSSRAASGVPALVVGNGTANQALRVTFRGREWTARPAGSL